MREDSILAAILRYRRARAFVRDERKRGAREVFAQGQERDGQNEKENERKANNIQIGFGSVPETFNDSRMAPANHAFRTRCRRPGDPPDPLVSLLRCRRRMPFDV